MTGVNQPRRPIGTASASSDRLPTSSVAIAALLAAFASWPLAWTLGVDHLAGALFVVGSPCVLSVAAIGRTTLSKGQAAVGGKYLATTALVLNCAGIALGFLGLLIWAPCSSRQSDAKGNLRMLYVAEESYRADFDRYSLDPAPAGFTPRISKKRDHHEYVIVSADKDHFVGEARGRPAKDASSRSWGDGEMEGDLWRITDKNDLVNVTNRCSFKRLFLD